MSDNMDFVNDGSGDVYELDELLGAFALDAVDLDERQRVEDYLTVNPRAAAEVEQHREVATMLAFTGMAAPAGLWERIEGELDGPAPAPGPELAKVFGSDAMDQARERVRSRRRLGAIGPWVAGAAAAAVIGVVAFGIADRADAPLSPIAEAIDAARADRDSKITTLAAAGSPATAEGVIDQDGHGYLDATLLPTLEEGKTYQLWGVMSDSGDVISLGILGPNPEIETFTVEGSVAALAVTIEDAPGVVADGNPDGAYVGEF